MSQPQFPVFGNPNPWGAPQEQQRQQQPQQAAFFQVRELPPLPRHACVLHSCAMRSP